MVAIAVLGKVLARLSHCIIILLSGTTIGQEFVESVISLLQWMRK